MQTKIERNSVERIPLPRLLMLPIITLKTNAELSCAVRRCLHL